MSVVVTTCEDISHHPLNTSKTKQIFSFNKAPRFKDNAEQTGPRTLYVLPPLQEPRKTSMGYGTKYDFTKMVNGNPGPNSYKTDSIFDEKISKKRGFTIAPGREVIKFQSFNSFLKNQKTPGPGTYDNKLEESKYKGASLKSRSGPLNALQNGVPGPGFYEVPTSISKVGSYVNSKFKNSGAPTFSNSKIARKFISANNVPGAGHYNQEIPQKDGVILISKFKSPGTVTIGHGVKESKSILNLTPGPGSYVIPSDFGIYKAKSKNANNEEKSIDQPEKHETKENADDVRNAEQKNFFNKKK